MSKYLILTIVIMLCSLSVFGVPTLPLPPRPPDAMGSDDFVAYITPMSLTDRENAIQSQVASGNVPDFIRQLKPVTITGNISGKNHTATYYVLPDYVAIGSDEDYFLCPMTPLVAQKIADMCGCILPTKKMVDDIWKQAEVKLAPAPIPPSPEMTTVPVFSQHNDMVWEQRLAQLSAHPPGALVSGDKKDVVITNLIQTHPGKVAIYGWHRLDGTPIQPLYLGHSETYADYSHGIRLIKKEVIVDGVQKVITDVLKAPDIAPLLSDEGTINKPRYPVPLPMEFPYRDTFPAAGRELDSWQDKFTESEIIPFSPTSPGGDGYVLVVKDPAGGMETTRIGNLTDADYFAQCDIYCNYRPQLESDGFERVGIFIRDNGNGAFEHTHGGGGYCYILAWDSGDGRLWCVKSVNGATTDLAGTPIHRPSTAWRRMRIEARGSQLTFKCDGEAILTVSDSSFSQGQCGIGWHEYFTTDSNMQGTIADNFLADSLGTEPTSTPTPSPTPTPTPHGENLVANGSFEEGFTNGVGNGWHKWQAPTSNDVTCGQASINRHDGNYSQYWARPDTITFLGGVYQRIPVTPGVRYQLKAWLKHQSIMEGTGMAFGYDLYGGTDGTSPSVIYTDMSDAVLNEWTLYTSTLTAKDDYITIFSRGGHTGTTGGTNCYFYLDEVSMYGISATPTPTPTPGAVDAFILTGKRKLPSFQTSAYFKEQVKSYVTESEVKILINSPSEDLFDPEKPTMVIFYALPNGNTTAQTIGKRVKKGINWHFGIQHIGAQTRCLREIVKDQNIVTVYLETKQKSWPLWRRKHLDGGFIIKSVIRSVMDNFRGMDATVSLSSHSGGGSFIFGFINAMDKIPDEVKRISFLDSNYAFSDKEGHGDKISEWLKSSSDHFLIVICYDDRKVTFKGKPIVSKTGGTFRKTLKMVERLKKDFELKRSRERDIIKYRGLDGRIDIIMHTNPSNEILHTRLVGDMNGFIYAATCGTKYENKAPRFGAPVAYEKWIKEY